MISHFRAAALTLLAGVAFCTPAQRQAVDQTAAVATVGCKVVTLATSSTTVATICATEEEIAAMLPAVEAIFADRAAADAGVPSGGALRRLKACKP